MDPAVVFTCLKCGTTTCPHALAAKDLHANAIERVALLQRRTDELERESETRAGRIAYLETSHEIVVHRLEAELFICKLKGEGEVALIVLSVVAGIAAIALAYALGEWLR